MITQAIMDWFRDIAVGFLSYLNSQMPTLPAAPSWVSTALPHLYGLLFGSSGAAVVGGFLLAYFAIFLAVLPIRLLRSVA